ncbi:response regulator [Gloeobacter kilaueensis]|uniref:Two component transcriptional regulator, winged helix family n=1 Tax=Gloeobacter kilaueensis (strain ATCC BAA-2537 / CCAP 1431/1 / ULC 316 / JS1) TaxID=1183438 RepID=U5QMZ1_GLOK1|nr:response regulator [Gloeobacter kilaueensis]AGY58964.1 two component transcriptional regulator, winged helix family [Gloeobacter kilaueensis JS1]
MSIILIIEDDWQIRHFLQAALLDCGYKLIEAATGREGISQVATRRPELILLALSLPDVDGLEVIRQLREWTQVPIIALSTRDKEDDKITALDAGADDCLTKPFGAGELLARMRVALRRSVRNRLEQGQAVFRAGDLLVDIEHRRVFAADREVHLTPLEYKLLVTLMRQAGKVLTHQQLLTEVWGLSYAKESHYLRVYMAQLRHKLEADPARPRHLVTEPRVGYRLKSD